MTDATNILETLKASCKTSDMFYTPETKGALQKWLESMPAEYPTGIAVMVGYNYAMSQVQQILDGTHPDVKETRQ